MHEQELVMSPEVHERIAVAESKISTTQADVAKILVLVEKMPRRFSRRMQRLLEDCRKGQAATYGLKKASVAEPERDWSQTFRTILVGAAVVGSLLGGAYQAVNSADKPPAQQIQGGSK